VHRSRLRRLVTLAGLTGLFVLPGLSAQELDHAPLATDPTLSFSALLEQTLRHAPNALEGPVREAEARDMNALGESWIAGRPSVQLDAIDDRLLNDLGQRELTWGVAMPLWRPGERRAMQARGAQYEAQYAAWEDAFTLDIVGQLRTALADMAEADAVLAAEQLATADARELVRIAELRFAAGDIAERELLQAHALLLSQQRNELEAEAGRVDAERLYATLTGLQVRPASLPEEVIAAQDEVPDSHPLLRLLQADVAVAAAEIDKAEADARGAPTLTMGTRRQRAGLFADYEDALAVSLNIPLGGRAHVNAATTAERRSKVDAEVRQAMARRALALQLHEVEHALFVMGEALPLSEEQARLARRQWEMARAAFEAGETDISQVVIALQQTRLSARELETNTLRHARLIAEFNQILGVLP
jgi:cobalt-zinc-cadmium efflux system outer membrane protein